MNAYSVPYPELQLGCIWHETWQLCVCDCIQVKAVDYIHTLTTCANSTAGHCIYIQNFDSGCSDMTDCFLAHVAGL